MAYVLLVDDHPDLVEVLTQLLTARGHTVECSHSAEDALARMDLARPDVIIADQRLPGMSGLDLIRAIRARPVEGEVPVVLCSADDSLAQEARRAGAMEFWVKGSEQLFEHVDQLAQRLCDDPRPAAFR